MFPITRFANVFKLGSEQNYRTAINWRLKAHDDRGITETEHFGRVLSVFVWRQLRKIVFYRDIVSLTCSLHEIRFTDSLRRVAAFHVTMGKIFASVVWVEEKKKKFCARERKRSAENSDGVDVQGCDCESTFGWLPHVHNPPCRRPPRALNFSQMKRASDAEATLENFHSTLSRLKLHHSQRSPFGFEKLCKQINRSMNAKWRRGGCGWTEKLSSCITQESLFTLPYTHLEFQFRSFSRLCFISTTFMAAKPHTKAQLINAEPQKAAVKLRSVITQARKVLA